MQLQAILLKLYAGTGVSLFNRSNSFLNFGTNNAERMRIDSSGNVGIGTLAIMEDFGGGRTTLALKGTGTADYSTLQLGNYGTSSNGQIHGLVNFYDGTTSVSRIQSVRVSNTSDAHLAFYTAPSSGGITERARLDSNGNLLVGKTALDGTGSRGLELRADGLILASKAGQPMSLDRTGSDGVISGFYKDGAIVGSIGVQASGTLFIAGSSSQNTGLRFFNTGVAPCTSSGAYVDNSKDLGSSSVRWDDVYATNGTIQTSDRNEKQDIAELSEAEQRVAVACKGLLRKFRWKDSVAEKGDDARIHFGIIAQDLQAAFEAEGLDAGDYAMFISTTWTDEETNEEKTRMGVRYSELLAFIISAI